MEREQGGKTDCSLAFFHASNGYMKLSSQQGAAAYSSVSMLRLGSTDPSEHVKVRLHLERLSELHAAVAFHPQLICMCLRSRPAKRYETHI